MGVEWWKKNAQRNQSKPLKISSSYHFLLLLLVWLETTVFLSFLIELLQAKPFTRYSIHIQVHWNTQFTVHSTLIFTWHKSLTLDLAIILNFTVSNDIFTSYLNYIQTWFYCRIVIFISFISRLLSWITMCFCLCVCVCCA